MKNLVTLVNQLRSYSSEREWFEFKVNWFEPAAIGEYTGKYRIRMNETWLSLMMKDIIGVQF